MTVRQTAVITVVVAAALSGCAGGDTRPAAAECVAANDNLIVPGCRIGPVAVGMTEADLLRAIGSPERSNPLGSHQGASVTIYEYESRGRRQHVHPVGE